MLKQQNISYRGGGNLSLITYVSFDWKLSSPVSTTKLTDKRKLLHYISRSKFPSISLIIAWNSLRVELFPKEAGWSNYEAIIIHSDYGPFILRWSSFGLLTHWLSFKRDTFLKWKHQILNWSMLAQLGLQIPRSRYQIFSTIITMQRKIEALDPPFIRDSVTPYFTPWSPPNYHFWFKKPSFSSEVTRTLCVQRHVMLTHESKNHDYIMKWLLKQPSVHEQGILLN